MYRRSLIALLLLCSTVAVAGGQTRQSVHGEGIIVSEDRREGLFNIRAVKVGDRIEGSFRFVTGNLLDPKKGF